MKYHYVRYGILIAVILLFCSFQTDTQPQYLRVRLVKNMSINDLMTLYQLHEFDCNKTLFVNLNKLTNNTPLSKNKEYTLPIRLVAFNDKSIRSSTGISNLEKAKYIQSYNENLLNTGVRKQSYKQSKFLFVPHHVIACFDERKIKPTTTPQAALTEGSERERVISGSSKRRYAIFGKKYQDVPIISRKLKGKIFYVESGHGGPDPGAMTKVNNRTLCEDEYAYDIALRIARILIQHSATVFIINRDPNDGIRDTEYLLCDKDERTFPDLKIPTAHKPRLTQRSDAINELYDKFYKKGIKDQRAIIIHVDSRSKSEQTDTFLYYQNEKEASKKLASRMQQTLEQKYASRRDYKGTVSTRDLHMLRESKPTTVFVELGNIRNSFDRKRIMEANNRRAIAAWLTEGFMK